MSLVSGTRLGPYEILALVGAGGMGEVYRARDTKLKRDVALKVLPEAFALDPERLARFEREAEVLASLNHPNIAAIYGVVEDRALVMELVEGAEPRGPMPLDEAWKIASQIAAALEYAHDKGIVHRDLKPANVKVTPEGVVKLLDFGLAKAFTNQRETSAGSDNSPTMTLGATEAGVILGTAAYMAPEQARGRTVDQRADIWAFGAVLYEMLIGKVLFRGETVSDIMVEILGKEPDLSALPVHARYIVERCLRKDPRRRWQAIGDVRIALEEGVAEPSTPAPPVETKRRLLPWAITGVFLLVSMAASFTAWRATRSAAGAGDLPFMRFDADLGPDAVEGSAYAGALAVMSPDGARVVYSARTSDGKQMLAIRPLDRPKGSLLAGTENGFDPFFSPDGQWLGFFADRKLKKIALSGGAPVVLCDVADPRGATWGEDGTIVAALTNTTGLSRLSASGGAPRQLTELRAGESTHRWPQFLPGGQTIVFTASSSLSVYENASIDVVILKTGERKTLQAGGYFGRYASSGHLLYVHQGVLLAAPMDASALKPLGTPVPLLEDVASVANAGAGQFDISRNGIFVYRSGKAGWETWLLATLSEKEGSTKVQSLLSMPGSYHTPRFSPDGRRVALALESATGMDISVYDLERESLSRLTFVGQETFSPVWTPDGKHIAFQSIAGNNYGIGWMRSDGAGGVQKLLEGRYSMLPSAISADGRHMAYYETNPETNLDVWTTLLDMTDADHPKLGKPEPFARTASNEAEPAFSPDGRWLAYDSDESGAYEVYVAPFPQSAGGGKWQISSGGGKMPVWSRNGSKLFFENPEKRIMVAAYTTQGDSFFASKPRLWSDQELVVSTPYPNFDVSPDGAKIVGLIRPQGAEGTKGNIHVTFLLNLFDELHRRVPVPGR
jgi:Tol biopolymer transport system component